MDFSTGDLRNSLLKGLLSAIISAPIAYYVLRTWVVMAISLGPVDKIYATIDTATMVVAILTFLSGFLSSYLRLDL